MSWSYELCYYARRKVVPVATPVKDPALPGTENEAQLPAQLPGESSHCPSPLGTENIQGSFTLCVLLPAISSAFPLSIHL